MSEMRGLIMIDRAMLNHPVVGGKKSPERFFVWSWMLSAAAWKTRKIFVYGTEITLQRGQFMTSLRNIEKATGVSKRVIERLVRDLKTVTMIETATVTGGTIITICNYETYQDFDNYRGQGAGQQRGQGGDREGTGRGQGGDIKEHLITPDKQLDDDDSALDAKKNDVGDLTFRERILVAMGHDKSGTTATGRQLGSPADMLVFKSWMALGLSIGEVIDQIAFVASRKRDGPANSFKYFTGPIEDLARQKTAAPLKPIAPTGGTAHGHRNSGGRGDRTLSIIQAAARAPTPS